MVAGGDVVTVGAIAIGIIEPEYLAGSAPLWAGTGADKTIQDRFRWKQEFSKNDSGN